MNLFKSYIILNRKTNFITNFFILISVMFLITLILLSQLKYKKYYQTIGQVINDGDKFKLILYIEPNKLNKIKNNNELIINDKSYKYKIDIIDSDYIISNELKNYLKIVLNISLKEEDKINNNLLSLKILESNKKIIHYLKYYLMKGEFYEDT